MPREWFIKTKTGPQGPVDRKTLIRLVGMGKLKPNTPVSHDGQSWIKAKKIAGLSFPAGATDAEDEAESNREAGSVKWYVRTKHSVAGPFRPGKLNKLARQGRIQPNVAVSHDGLTWIKAKRVPGIVFSDADVETKKTSAVDETNLVAQESVAPEQLKFPFDVGDERPNFRRTARVQQLTLFCVDQRPLLRLNRDEPRRRDDYPLFSWSPNVRQLRLFDRTDVEEYGHPPPRQLELSLFIGNEQIAETRRTVRAQQLTLFPGIRPPILESRSDQPCVIGDWPLFHSPPNVVQLRLFDRVTADSKPHVDKSLANHLPRPPQRASDESHLAEPSAVEAQHRLHGQWAQVRQSEYNRRFGAFSHIARPQDAAGVPVDVYVFPPNEHRPVTTLVTSGMSNHRMPVPQGRCSRRAELVLYVSQLKAEYVNLLYFLAQLPLQQNEVLRYGTALDHGNPPRPIFPGSMLDGYVLMIPSVETDFKIHESTRIGDDSLQLLWVVPTTHAERNFLATQGMGRFCWLLDQERHPLVFDPSRSCYVDAASNLAG